MSDRERPILIIGKSGTGKTTLAKTLVRETPLIFYANELVDCDWLSVTSDIIIEEVHYKPKKDIIMAIIRNVKSRVILTSDNQKSVSKDITNCCKIRRAGSAVHSQTQIKLISPRSNEPSNVDKTIFEIISNYLTNPNREEVIKMLKYNKPADVQLLTWLGMNLHPNRLTFVDGRVKRKWSMAYFYELLAYSHDGRIYSKVQYPKRASYSKIPSILSKLKLKPNEVHLLKQLLLDDEFAQWVKKHLRSDETRVIGMKDRTRARNAPINPDRTLKLEGWF